MRRPDIGYGGREFRFAMGKMSEFYLQYHAVVCCDDFDGSAYLLDIAEKVKAATGCPATASRLSSRGMNSSAAW